MTIYEHCRSRYLRWTRVSKVRQMKQWVLWFVTVLVIGVLSVYLLRYGSQNTPLVSSEPESDMIDPRLVLATQTDDDIYRFYELGKMHYEGRGVEKNYTKAEEAYRKSCDLKYGVACADVAAMYANGIGVPESRKRALEYYEKACDYGYAGGCKNWNIINGYRPEVPNRSQN